VIELLTTINLDPGPQFLLGAMSLIFAYIIYRGTKELIIEFIKLIKGVNNE